MFTFAVAHAGVDLFIVLLSRESFKNMRIHPSKGSKSVSHICILYVDLCTYQCQAGGRGGAQGGYLKNCCQIPYPRAEM